ncbi:DUF4241 domain-containing protein [Actinophytocola xanthii]|uniref:DUF4241 domain-containing protein n=1 Tax=Actinophytocola xanthii TaxID=1912961 RepID=UPI00130174BF|nr:DUF4241 domain-containing protein [Actinophytocola xanthii]
MSVEIVFCEGWDPGTRSAVRPLPADTAAERDAGGEQYALLLTGERPLALVEVCWAANHAAVWRIDEQGRRDRRLELRRWPDGRLRVRELRQWAYESSAEAEFQAGRPAWRTPRWVAAYRPDGERTVSTGGWSGPDLELAVTSWPVPTPEGWPAVVAELLGEPVQASPAEDPAEVADPPLTAPWHPPVPLRPVHVREAFDEGARFEIDGGLVRVEVVDAGPLRLPTGSLVVADPDPWLADVAPFVETAPPGEYPVRLSVVRFADDPDHTRVAAAAVVLSDADPVVFDHAWRPGEQELLLGDGEFFGVGVDGGRVALVDASAGAAFAELVEGAYGEMTGWAHELAADGANLVSVESGWGDGSYPVWVGRDEQGRLTCFVVDFLLLAHARPAS